MHTTVGEGDLSVLLDSTLGTWDFLCGFDSSTLEYILGVIAVVGGGTLEDVDTLCSIVTAGDSRVPLLVWFSGSAVIMAPSWCVVGTDVTLTEVSVLTDRFPFLDPKPVLSKFSEFK